MCINEKNRKEPSNIFKKILCNRNNIVIIKLYFS